MPRKITPHLSEALEEFMAIKGSHMARNSLNNYRSQLSRFMAGVRDRRVHLLTASATEAWFADAARDQQPSSYNKVRTTVSTFLAFCSRRGWLDHDPMAEIRPRRVPKKEPCGCRRNSSST